MQKIKDIYLNIKSWSLRRKIFFGVLLLIVIIVLYRVLAPADNSANTLTDIAKRVDLKETVLATGQVTSETDLSLSFNATGVLKGIKVSVGDSVKKGQILATLDQGSVLASLTSARGTVAQSQAKYAKILEGSTDTEIALSRVLLQNAKNSYAQIKLQQDLLVMEAENKYQSDLASRVSNFITAKNDFEYAKKTRDASLSSAQADIDQRQAELNIKLSQARSSDIDLANADIISAQGQLQAAIANYENTVLRAPADGTITKVDIKLGELVQSLKEVMVLQDVKNVYLEANINEANIARVKVGSIVDITFDSLGTDKIFKGSVLKIDPASTVVSGVVNYKVTASVDSITDIRPGMTSNMTILINEKMGVVTVPSRAILTAKDGSKTIRVITDSKKKKFIETPVSLGVSGDGGLVEILSGVKEGDEVVTLIKKA